MFLGKNKSRMALAILFLVAFSQANAKSRTSDWAIVKAFKSLGFKQQLLDFANILKMQATAEQIVNGGNKVTVKIEIVEAHDPRIAESMRRSSDTAAVTNMRIEGEERIATIYICNRVKYFEKGIQAYIIFHELAHAYDPNLWNGMSEDDYFKQNFYGYPCIQEEAQEYMDNQQLGFPVEILSYEWYAEWKAIQKMKRHRPSHEIRALERYFQQKRDREKDEGITSYKYPPAKLLLKWLAQ
jgi:hypothetical protein